MREYLKRIECEFEMLDELARARVHVRSLAMDVTRHHRNMKECAILFLLFALSTSHWVWMCVSVYMCANSNFRSFAENTLALSCVAHWMHTYRCRWRLQRLRWRLSISQFQKWLNETHVQLMHLMNSMTVRTIDENTCFGICDADWRHVHSMYTYCHFLWKITASIDSSQ